MKTCHLNILESGTVTLTAGTAHADYPLYRLYDRGIGRFFKTTAAVTTEVKIDQGGSPIAVDRLLIPSGHNLNGMTLDILWSQNDADYSPAVSQWSGAAGLINKYWTALTKRYWKFKVTTPGGIPQVAELFLTSTYEWERNPSRPAGPLDAVFNVEAEASTGGQDRFLIHGDPKRQRVYPNCRAGESQKANLLALNDAWAGAKPFWLYDHEGNWLYGKLRSPLSLKEIAYGAFSFEFDFLEVIP